MAEIKLQDCSFHYSDFYKPVFENVNIIIDTQWRLGLIGRNGRGKTTLLHMLKGDLLPSSGVISNNKDIEMFPYTVDEKYSRVVDVMKENIGGVKTLEIEMEKKDLTDETQLAEYSNLLQKYLDLDGYEIESKIKKELYLMNLSENLLYRKYDSLSGGEKTKIQIIILFLRNAEYVLLDEPTNHLDTEGKQYLSEYLRRKKGFCVASHDSDFLDTVVDHILAINKSSVEIEKGNFSTWRENKKKRELFEMRTREKIIREIKQLERQAEEVRNWAGVANKQKYAFKSNARTNGAKAYMMRAKNAEIRVKNDLEKKKQLLKNYEKHQDLVIEQDNYNLNTLMYVKRLTFSYGDRPLLKDLSFIVERGDCVWIKGKNGCGKSTLLKILLGEIIPVKGSVDLQRDVSLTAIRQEPLLMKGCLRDYINNREQLERIQSLCKTFDLSHEVLERPIETYSSGEQKKIEIAKCFASKNQIIIMDEPLNYMDIYFKQQLEEAILKFKPTIVFVEHNIHFGEKIANKIISLD